MTRRTKLWLILLLAVLLVVTVVVVATCTNTATVSFDKGAADATGTAPDTEKVIIGRKISIPSNPFSRDGYDFDGWSDGNKIYQVGEKYTVESDVTFTAQWKEKDVSGGDGHVCGHVCGNCGLCTDTTCNDPVCNEKCEENTTEKHECQHVCEVCHKCQDADCEDSVCVDKCNCQAVETKYTLSYDLGEHAAEGETPLTDNDYVAGANVILASAPAAAEGYVFAGWSDGTNTYYAGEQFTMPANAVTMTAIWECAVDQDVEYALSYSLGEHAAEGETTPATKDYAPYTFVELAQAPTAADGWIFVGWYDGESTYGAGEIYTMPNHEVTMTAQWEADKTPVETDITGPFNGFITSKSASGTNIVGILYLRDDGTGRLEIHGEDSANSLQVNCNVEYTLANGVITVTSATDSNILTPVSGTVNGRTVSITLENLAALESDTQYVFESALIKYTSVNLYGKDEICASYFPVGTTVDLTEVALDGHVLEKIVVNGEDKDVSWLASFTVFNEDTTIEFVWSRIPSVVEYKVTYLPGEGTGTQQTVTTTSAQYTLNSVWFEGWEAPLGGTFVGWLIDGQVYASGDTITLTGNVTAVAQWQYNVTVTLALGTDVVSNLANAGWVDNSVSLSPASAASFYLPYGEPQEGFLYVSREGFTLTGWISSIDGQTYAPGASVVITQDVTFTAVWQPNTDETHPTEPKEGVFVGEFTIENDVFKFTFIFTRFQLYTTQKATTMTITYSLNGTEKTEEVALSELDDFAYTGDEIPNYVYAFTIENSPIIATWTLAVFDDYVWLGYQSRDNLDTLYDGGKFTLEDS